MERETITVEVSRAGDIDDLSRPPHLVIKTTNRCPSFKNLEVAAMHYDQQAQALCDALFKSLPGGVMDRLLVALMKRYAGHLIVPRFSDE